MMVKAVPGHGSIRRAVDYLLGANDGQHRERRSVELLHGDPELMVRLVDALPYQQGYDSLVVAYAVGEEHSIDELHKLLKRLTDIEFPGLGDRVASMAVLHRDDYSMHLHILYSRIDLVSGQQCSVKGFGIRPLRELCRMINLEKGWADPSDPCRAQLAYWKSDVVIQEDVLERNLSNGTNVHEYARSLILSGVLQGQLATQQDVASTLAQIGRVEKLDRHSITVSVPGIRPRGRVGIRVKFAGLLYAHDFDPLRILGLLGPWSVPQHQLRRNTTAEEDLREAASLTEKFKRDVARRAEEMKRRYAPTPTRARRSLTTRVGLKYLQLPAPTPIDVRRRNAMTHEIEVLKSIPRGKSHAPEVEALVNGIYSRSRGSISAGARASIGRAIHRAEFAWLGSGFAGMVEAIARQALESLLRAVRGSAARRCFAHGIEAKPGADSLALVERNSGQDGQSHSPSIRQVAGALLNEGDRTLPDKREPKISRKGRRLPP